MEIRYTPSVSKCSDFKASAKTYEYNNSIGHVSLINNVTYKDTVTYFFLLTITPITYNLI